MKLTKEIKTGGLLKYVHNEEHHDYNPDIVKSLQECVSTGYYEDYRKYADLVNERNPSFMRDLLSLKSTSNKISITK